MSASMRVAEELADKVAEYQDRLEYFEKPYRAFEIEWSKAPDWATWWAVDPDGMAWWFEVMPVLPEKGMVVRWTMPAPGGTWLHKKELYEWTTIPTGLDWRLLKRRRPKGVPSETQTH